MVNGQCGQDNNVMTHTQWRLHEHRKKQQRVDTGVVLLARRLLVQHLHDALHELRVVHLHDGNATGVHPGDDGLDGVCDRLQQRIEARTATVAFVRSQSHTTANSKQATSRPVDEGGVPPCRCRAPFAQSCKTHMNGWCRAAPSGTAV